MKITSIPIKEDVYSEFLTLKLVKSAEINRQLTHSEFLEFLIEYYKSGGFDGQI